MISCPKCSAPCLDSHRYCPACGADLSTTPIRGDEDSALIGTTIAGKFVLRELIGSGGMGKVFRADQKGVGRTVAVKIMHRHLVGDETAGARFTNEARASSSLNHPHSIAVLDFGQTEVGMLYIVMEYLEGMSLDGLLRKEFPLPLGRVAHLVCQALDAVEAAHHQNIIHRDLKPENVFLLQQQSRDFVKVLDFGIAKMLDHEDRSVTTPGLVPGTPEYMSPEQARGEKLDPRSDVYSMGVILYELLTATVPFRGSSAVATMMSHVQDPVPPPSKRRPDLDIPASLESIVLWSLAKNTADRIVSAAQFKEVLSAWARVAGVWTALEQPAARASSALLDIFSEDQVTEIPAQIAEQAPYPTQGTRESERPPLMIFAANGLVGRERERGKLRDFVERKGPRSMVIEGEVGMGKSRLVGELVQVGRDAGLDVLRCSPAPGWAPELLHTAQEIALHCLRLSSEDHNAAAILQGAGSVSLDAEDVPGLQELFNLPSHLSELEPGVRRRERAAAFRALVYLAASKQPLLLIVEQYGALDAVSQELVASLVERPQGEFAIAVVCDPQDRPSWGDHTERLVLEPMSTDQTVRMARRMFDDSADRKLVENIGRAANGHPLFVEQMAHAVANEELTDPPERLGDLVAARVQRLSQADRSMLQWVAVYNEAVSAEMLSRFSGQEIRPNELERLAKIALLGREQSRGHNEKNRSRQRYIFAHRLVAMVVYSSIPAEVRREMHQAVAEFLRQADAPVTTIAYHAYEADDGPRAVEELDRAGVWSERCLDPKTAIHHYTNALDLVRREWGRGRVAATDLDQMAVELALRLGAVLRETGDVLTAEGVVAEVLSVAAGRDSERAKLRLELGRLDLDRGNLQRATRHLQLARADAEAAESSYLLGEITRELARARGATGDRSEAGRLLFAALEESTRASGQRQGPSWNTLLGAASTSAVIGFPERARGYLLDALQQAENERSLQGKLRVVMRMATLHQANGELHEAEVRILQGLDLVGQIGDRSRKAELLLTLGQLHRIRGDVEGARQYLEQSRRICQRIDWQEGIGRVDQETEMLRFAIPQML
jgi:serine/threonine protein kinase/tetratricopeptide (TPR) repeat protein